MPINTITATDLTKAKDCLTLKPNNCSVYTLWDTGLYILDWYKYFGVISKPSEIFFKKLKF